MNLLECTNAPEAQQAGRQAGPAKNDSPVGVAGNTDVLKDRTPCLVVAIHSSSVQRVLFPLIYDKRVYLPT
eukprot:1160252-Pelagomonas_calceolata.AAC.21